MGFRIASNGHAESGKLFPDKCNQFVGITKTTGHRAECLLAGRRIAPQRHDVIDPGGLGLFEEQSQGVARRAYAGEVAGDRERVFAFEAARDRERLVARAATRTIGAGYKRRIVFGQFIEVFEKIGFPFGRLRREELVGQSKPAVRIGVAKLCGF